MLTIHSVENFLSEYNRSHPSEPLRRAAVLIPLIERDGNTELLFEVRALTLKHQPGDVCFPGGRVESDEAPLLAAIRETEEELLIKKEQLRIIGQIPIGFTGPSGQQVFLYAAELTGYDGRFSKDEVDRVFSLPLQWFLDHPPMVYKGRRASVPPDDFPFDLIRNGRNYRWGSVPYEIPLYLGTEPLIWGMTARVIRSLCEILKEGGLQPAESSVL